MPKCMKTGGTCTLHKNYKTPQLGHTSGKVEVQPLSPSLTLPHPPSEFKPWNKRTLYTVLYLCVGLYQMQTAKVTVYGS